MLQRTHAADVGQRILTFSLPLEWAGRASVVGNFNDWTPGALPFAAVGDGAEASVSLPDDYTAVFRYLGEGGHWFDEPEADHIDGGGSVVWGLERDEVAFAVAVPEPREAAWVATPAGQVDAEASDPRPPSPAERSVAVAEKKRRKMAERAEKAAEKARRKASDLAAKVAKAGDKQRKAAARMAKEAERRAQKDAERRSAKKAKKK